MKKKVIILLLAVIAALLVSCRSLVFRNLYIDDAAISNSTFVNLINAISNQDPKAIKSLFSQHLQQNENNVDESIAELLNYIDGDIVAYSDAEEMGIGVDTNVEHGKTQKFIQSSFRLVTSEETYFIAIRQCILDEASKNNVGLISVYVINADNWPHSYAYRGDGVWTAGISIVR